VSRAHTTSDHNTDRNSHCYSSVLKLNTPQFEDILQNKGVRTTMIIINIAVGNAVICHLMCCFWVLVGRNGINAGWRGDENWIENAGFELEDTETGT
jgi:hypothetical protein